MIKRHLKTALAVVALALAFLFVTGFDGCGKSPPRANSNANVQPTPERSPVEQARRFALEKARTAQVGLRSAFEITENLSKTKLISVEKEREVLGYIKTGNAGLKRLAEYARKLDPDRISDGQKLDLSRLLSEVDDALALLQKSGIIKIKDPTLNLTIESLLSSVVEAVNGIRSTIEAIQTLKE